MSWLCFISSQLSHSVCLWCCVNPFILIASTLTLSAWAFQVLCGRALKVGAAVQCENVAHRISPFFYCPHTTVHYGPMISTVQWQIPLFLLIHTLIWKTSYCTIKSYFYLIFSPNFEPRNSILDEKMHVEGHKIADFDKIISKKECYRTQIICETPDGSFVIRLNN